MGIRSFLNRFVHPWIAAIAIIGVVCWGVSFLAAATGLVIRSPDTTILTVELFVTSGLIGLAGSVILVACGLWLVGLRTIQIVRGRRS